jgi:hypothetical protein
MPVTGGTHGITEEQITEPFDASWCAVPKLDAGPVSRDFSGWA